MAIQPIRRFISRGWLIALVILIVIECLVGRSEWIWSYEARSNSGVVDVLESEVISKVDDPSVVFLGSSRIRDAVLPRELEAMMALPNGSVLNLGLTGGRGYDSLKIYQRNRERLSLAETIVIGVELSDFTTNPTPNERVRRYASLSERLEWPSSDRLGLLVGYLWRTYDVRDQLRGLVTGLWRGRDQSIPLDPDGRIAWREPIESGPDTVDVSTVVGEFANAEPGLGHSIYIKQLIEILNADGVEVWVVHVPVRNAIAHAYASTNPAMVAYLRQSVESLEGINGFDLPWSASNVDNLHDTGFYDYGHPATSGAQAITRHYANLIADGMETSG